MQNVLCKFYEARFLCVRPDIGQIKLRPAAGAEFPERELMDVINSQQNIVLRNSRRPQS
jgi:hypothetical protein